MDNPLITDFSVGDTVVHPQHGVGHVSKMEEKQFEPNTSKLYYVISIKDTTIWVQVDNPTSGLRKLGSSKDLDRCIKVLQSPPQTLTPGRDLISSLTIRIKMGTISSHCEVVRDISAFGWHKPLYGPIADFQRTVFNVLSQEWSEVKGVSQVDASHEINSFLKKGRLVNESMTA